MSSAVRASAPYKENRVRKVKDKKTGETKEVVITYWACMIETEPRPDGSRERKAIRRKNRNDLIKAKNELVARLASGEQLRRDKTTVEGWLTYWLEHIAQPRMRPRPWASYCSMVKRNIVPHIGRHQLAKLEPQHVRYMLEQILAAGLSVRTAEAAYNLLHRSIQDARREPSLGLRENVVELVDKPRVATRTQDLAADAGRLRVLTSGRGRETGRRSRAALTADQARAVIRCALDVGDPYAVRYAFALLTGVRQGECLGLTTDRVDLDRGEVDLSWALSRVPLNRTKGTLLPVDDVYPRDAFRAPPGYELRPLFRGTALVRPKTDSSIRSLPLPEPLAVLLRAHIESMKPNRWGLLWVNEKGNPISGRLDNQLWSAALARAGAPDVVIHAARHTTATLLLQANVPEDVRMKIMGHSSAAAQRGYAHADVDVKRTGLAALDSLLDAS